MQDFLPGQRWISGAESEMGLGTVLSVEHRTVTIVFLATGETRTYSRETAPLTRVVFAAGDTILSHDGQGLMVESVHEQDGLLTYAGIGEDGRPAQLEEGELNNFIQLNRPTERLFNAQIDHDKWFGIRYQTLLHLNRLAGSDLRGLTGCRTSLIPHQMHIAHEVATRYAPRVLLADEVGLGKTIEAGLILHHQLITERAKRILIVVPESLVHQWLVEMLRRFNLFFSIFDEERCQAIEESGGVDNPFHTEQLVLCNLGFLTNNRVRFQQALAGDWDLLVVDEAHHLEWSPRQASPEYLVIEQLAAETTGVLLLTATPEQLGKAGHFARLRLLDADRFPDFETFVEEEKGYEPIAAAVEDLLTGRPLSDNDRKLLAKTIDEGDNGPLLQALQATAAGEQENTNARQQLVEHLLDRHGTGRVLFRNTRAAMKGFPERKLHSHPLPLPETYRACLRNASENDPFLVQDLLLPELTYQHASAPAAAHWSQVDPRVEWLIGLLGELSPAKVLVIAAHAETAIDLVQALKIEAGIHAAVFHEGMSIVDRDRAAAFFADCETGTQVLVCSEIGSEGRNFQFAHQMVLFDLPLNPDLLEQRIGRLDRIGQKQTIDIHVPWLEDSAQSILFRWYQQGLDAFEHTCPAGHTVSVHVKDALTAALRQPQDSIDELIDSTRRYHQELNDALHRGRDRLLEYNSCRPQSANALQERALMQDRDSSLPGYMDAIFDCFDIDTEPHSEHCTIIRPGNHMITPFPGLPDEGMTITYDRDTALANEDVQYITWEHPLTATAMDMALGSELGNTAVTAVRYPGLQPGTLLLESLYVLEPAPVEELQASRYLPPTTIRIVIDEKGGDHDAGLSYDLLRQSQVLVNTETANRIVRAREQALRQLVQDSEERARAQLPGILSTAHHQSRQTLETEINRLKALGRVNPNVRDDEIRFFERQLEALGQVLDSASLRLDALRVIVTT